MDFISSILRREFPLSLFATACNTNSGKHISRSRLTVPPFSSIHPLFKPWLYAVYLPPASFSKKIVYLLPRCAECFCYVLEAMPVQHHLICFYLLIFCHYNILLRTVDRRPRLLHIHLASLLALRSAHPHPSASKTPRCAPVPPYSPVWSRQPPGTCSRLPGR